MSAARRGEAAPDHYRTLGLDEDASPAEITRAYRDQLRRWHPDKQPTDSEAPARLRRTLEAYRVLGDEVRRARYDDARRSSRLAAGARRSAGDQPIRVAPHRPSAPDDQGSVFVVIGRPAVRWPVVLAVSDVEWLAD